MLRRKLKLLLNVLFSEERGSETGTVMVEFVLSLGVILPVLSGMFLVGQMAQERALVNQAIRAASRPVLFQKRVSRGTTEENPESEFQKIQAASCAALEFALARAGIEKSKYEAAVSPVTLGSEASFRQSRIFLKVEARQKNDFEVPFFGHYSGGGRFQTLFPIRVAMDEFEDADELNEFLALGKHQCF